MSGRLLGRWLPDPASATAAAVAGPYTLGSDILQDAVIGGLSAGLWDWDITSGRVRHSDTWRESLGYAPHDIASSVSAWTGLVHPADVARMTQALATHLEGATLAYESEHRIAAKSGEWRWVHDKGRVIARDETGRPLRVVGAQTDITARKEAERSRAFLLDLYHELNTLTDPAIMVDRAVASLGAYLDVAQVGFGEIDDAQTHVIIHRDWSDGRIPTIAGKWRLDDFGPAVVAEMKAGTTIAIADVTADARTRAPAVEAAYERIATRAILDVPMIRADRFHAMLFIHHPEPRAWTQAEVETVEAVCERLWDAVRHERTRAALTASEDRFARACEAANIATFDWDFVERRFLGATRMEVLHGLPPAGMRSREAFFGAIDRRDQSNVAMALLQIRNGLAPSPIELEYRVTTPEGLRWLRAQASVTQRASDGTPQRLSGIVMDISKQRHAAEALAEVQAQLLAHSRQAELGAERRFAATFEQAAVGIAHIDPAGRFLRVNDRYCEIAGYARDELLSQAFQNITHPDDLEADLDQMTRLMAGDLDHYAIEKRYLRKDGTVTWVNLTASLVRTADSGIDFGVAVIEDINDRKAAEHDLAEREAQLKTIVETVPVGLVMVEMPSGRIVGGNRYAEQLGGPMFTPADRRDRDARWPVDPAHESLMDSGDALFARMLSGDESPSLEVFHDRSDGSRGWTLMTGRPVRNEIGDVTGRVVALVDIDREKRAAQALSDALTAKEVLLYEVNHRVKNSLQLVTSILLLEASKIGDQGARAAVMAARDKIRHIAQLHQRLYSGGQHGAVDFPAFLSDLANDLVGATGRTDVKVAFERLDGAALDLRVAAPLAMAASEVVTNALKHGLADQAGTIRIWFENAEGSIVLRICDDGIGLPAGFDAQCAGSVGMQIISGLTAQIGGQLVARSRTVGTEFKFTVPGGELNA